MIFQKLHGKKVALTLILLVATTLLVACGASDSSTSAGETDMYDIRSLEDVSASGPPQITDLTADDAILSFESSIPLACSVVYGKTTDYGLVSVDLDMAGGAHTDHGPLLTGLEPDTIYHFRLQGTAPDGTLYISEDMTFHTPEGEKGTEINLTSLETGASSSQRVSARLGASSTHWASVLLILACAFSR